MGGGRGVKCELTYHTKSLHVKRGQQQMYSSKQNIVLCMADNKM